MGGDEAGPFFDGVAVLRGEGEVELDVGDGRPPFALEGFHKLFVARVVEVVELELNALNS